MASNNCLINGRSYSYADVRISFMGGQPVDIQGIKYSDKAAVQNNYGIGREPVDRTVGVNTYEGSITIGSKGADAFQAAIYAAGVERIQDLDEFDIIVEYKNRRSPMVRHVIRGCTFTGRSRDIKQGDMTVQEEWEFIPGLIDWNAR